jgi:Cu-Zn family superoxide dismutase
MGLKITPANPRQTNIGAALPQTKEHPMRPLVALVFAGLLCACATTAPDRDISQQTPARTVWIVGGEGRAVGQAVFTEAPTGVLIRLEFSEARLPPGWHGLHLHQRGDCSDFANGFQASGGHIGMARRIQHGLRNPSGPEAGDLPNLFASPAAPYAAEFFTARVTMAGEQLGDRLPLLDDDGAALLIHEGPDDQVSQPIGGAGARIACAALTRLP